MIWAHLGITEYDKAARHQAVLTVCEASTRMERPADLSTVAMETLAKDHDEFPAFRTLDTLARRVRNLVNTGFSIRSNQRLTDADWQALDGPLITAAGEVVLKRQRSPNLPQSVFALEAEMPLLQQQPLVPHAITSRKRKTTYAHPRTPNPHAASPLFGYSSGSG